MRRVLVIGGGFIGAALAHALSGHMRVRVACRRRPKHAAFADAVVTGDLGPDTDWRRALGDVDGVVLAAGPAHGRHTEAELQRAVVDGPAKLAREVAMADVRRFVLVSSIKAACSSSAPGAPVNESAPPRPMDRYGRAKLAGEAAVLSVLGARAVVLRPPLVFGAAARGNFWRLLRLADSGLPLPFGGLVNRRSLISLPSLVSALANVLTRDGPGGVYHVADRPSVTPQEMIAALRAGLGRPANTFCLPGSERLMPRSLSAWLEIDDACFRSAYGYGGHDAACVLEKLRACAAAWGAG